MNIDFYLNNKIIRKLTALLLTIMFLLIVGCDSNKGTSSKDTSSNKTSSVSGSFDDNSSENSSSDNNSSSDDNSSENSSSDNNSSSDTSDKKNEKISLDGGYILNDKVEKYRDDYGEPLYTGNCAQLLNPLKGYADKEATALRNKILNAENTEEIYEITGTKYYVSPGGDDNNDGKSPDTPIRTFSAVLGLALKEGDAVLFERGSVFRISNTISLKSGVTYGSYGEGAKPQIYASPKSLADPLEWTPTNYLNVWRTDFAYPETANLVFNHGEMVGYLQNSLKSLKKPYDYYHDEENGYLYLYYNDKNPGTLFKSIEGCPKTIIFQIPNLAKNIVIDNLCMKYSCWGAVNMYDSENIHITNCEIGFMGGCVYSSTARMGNAIGAWGGTDGWYIENNWIYQTFDTAISPQGQLDMVDEHQYDNIFVRNNLLEYNSCDYEFWCDAPHTLKNFDMSGNICRFTSLGWGTREDGGSRGINGVLLNTNKQVTPENVNFKNNIIDCPGREIITWDYYSDNGMYEAISMTGNTLYVKKSYRISDIVTANEFRIPRRYFATDFNSLKEAFVEFSTFGNIYWYD